MKRAILLRSCLLVLILFAWVGARAQAVVSVTDGPWNDPGTWSLPIIPDAGNTTSITVTHNVTWPAGFSATIDDTSLSGSLTVAGNLTVGATAGALNITGTLTAQNTAVISGTNGLNVVFGSGSTYDHAYTTNQGAVPLASWNANSTVRVSGFTTGKTFTAAGNWTQNFGHFTFDCTSLGGTTNFAGLITSVAGDLSIANTNGAQLYFGTTQNYTLAIGGKLTIDGTVRVVFTTTASPTLQIGTDFEFKSTNAGGSVTSTTGYPHFQIGRDFLMNASGGLLRLGYIGYDGGATFDVGRNMTVTAGSLYESSNDPGVGTFNFTNGASHSFSNSGSIQNNIHYVVGASDIVTVLGESALIGGISSQLDLSGELILKSQHASGALQTGYGTSPQGNVWVQNRIFNANSVVTYNGAGAQAIGNGNPTASNTVTRISNASGVSLNSPSALVTIGDLQVLTGTLTVSSNSLSSRNVTVNGGTLALTSSSTLRSITVGGNLQLTSGNLNVTSGAATAELVINGDILSGGGTINFTGAGGKITVGGSGSFSNPLPLSGTTTLATINVTRGGGGALALAQDVNVSNVTITSGGLDINSSKTLNISSNLNVATGGTLFFEGSTLTIGRFFNNTSTGGLLSSDASSTLNLTGSGVVGTLAFSPSGNTLGTLLLNRPSGGTLLTLNSSLNIASTFDLRDGVFLNTSGLAMGNGSGILITPNASFSASSVAPSGTYDLTYNNGSSPATTSMTTGKEAQGTIDDLSNNLTGTLTAGSALTVTHTLFLNSGIFSNPSSRLSMSSGATISRNTFGSMSGSIPGGGPYDVSYSGLTYTTGIEARGSVRDFILGVNGTITTSGTINVSRQVLANFGTLNIAASTLTMGNGTTFVRNSSASVSGSAPAGGPYNVDYTGTNLTTSVEAQGNLSTVTSDLSGNATQNSAITAAGLVVNSGTWSSGANTLSLGTLTNGASFIAPSTTLTLTGNLADNGIFQANGGTVIFNGNTSMTGSANTNFNHVQLNATHTLNAPAVFSVGGNITFAAGSTYNHNSGEIDLIGSSAQNIDVNGTQVYDVTVNKTGGSPTLVSAMNLAHVLQINSATAFVSGGFLTLLSQPGGPGDDVANDGSIGSLAGGGSVTGNVIVQRFMLTKGRNNKYVSGPVAGILAADITDDMTIQPGYLRKYNEPTAGNSANGYINLSSLDFPLTAGRGYLMFLDDAVNILWDVTGNINSGTVPLPVSYTTTSGGALHDGWNLVGNPFPSPIQWNNDNTAWTRSGSVDPVITVYENVGSSVANGGTGITTNSYTYNYTNGTGNLPNGTIATGQAFWVHLSAAGSLSVKEPAKISTAGGRFLRKSNQPAAQLTISLAGDGYKDHAFLVVDQNASDDFDEAYDGWKLKNEAVNVYFIDRADRHLVMQATDALKAGIDLPLGLEFTNPGSYQLSFAGIDAVPGASSMYLVDTKEGIAVPLSSLNSGSYTIQVAADDLTMTDRMYLSFSPETKSVAQNVEVRVYPNPTKNLVQVEAGRGHVIAVSLFDAAGNSITSSPATGNNAIDLSVYPNGVYILRVLTTEGVAVKKVLKTN